MTESKESDISVSIAVRAKLLRHLPRQQDSGWGIRGSGRVREDFVSRTRAGALYDEQVLSMMSLIAMKEESYLGSPRKICAVWPLGPLWSRAYGGRTYLPYNQRPAQLLFD